MKRKLKLKSWAKKSLLGIFIIAFVIVGTMAYTNRIEKINNGEFYLVCDYEMDR